MADLLVSSDAERYAIYDRFRSICLNSSANGQIGLFLVLEHVALSERGQRGDTVLNDHKRFQTLERGECTRQDLHDKYPHAVELIAKPALNMREHSTQYGLLDVQGLCQVID